MASSLKKLGKRIVHYEEEVPTVSSRDFVTGLFHSDEGKGPISYIGQYLYSLFPIVHWIGRYNLTWLTGDLIAGITVGIVAVPQAMSYAIIATLPAEYGLYSSFVGTLVYCFFATSKDVSIGPVAVMSLIVSQIIKHVETAHPGRWPATQIATTVSFICGFIVLGIGLLRIGRLVEFIPAPAVSGFMTGSAINIVAGQVPGLMGISGFNTRAATYEVIINTLKGLPRTSKDAAFGLVGLFTLYLIRWACAKGTKRLPNHARLFFFISVLRNAFVILILTLASWLYTRHRKDKKGKYPIKILGTVPSGFKHVRQPTIDPALVSALGSQLPVATIILLLEHIAISKSFGRLNNYKINPNQELIAIGVTNTLGTVFGAYPATGSFSRSAIKSKSGVRTPLAGIFTSVIVVVALYGLTAAFYWIPSAGLSALIIHAVADLIAAPPQVFRFWRISPLEFFIWLAAVLVTVFSSIDNGIYTSVAASLFLLLVRIAIPRGHFLGRVRIRQNGSDREVYVPLDRKDGVTNPHVHVEAPSAGIVIYRFEESFLYPNSSFVNRQIIDYVKEHTRRGKAVTATKLGDRPWNDPGPRHAPDEASIKTALERPVLHAIIFDFTSVSNLDTTAVQTLIDTRNEVERWADGPIEFHFATILSPWIRRALVAGGFGGANVDGARPSEIAPLDRRAQDHRDDFNTPRTQQIASDDIEQQQTSYGEQHQSSASYDTLVAADTPFFHFDLAGAVSAAEASRAGRSPGEKADDTATINSTGKR